MSEADWAFFEALPDAVLVLNSKGELRVVNEQCEQLFGYPRAELLGRALSFLLKEPSRETFAGRLAGIFVELTGVGLYELEGQRCDGKAIPLEARLRLTSLRGEQVMVVALRDTTDQRRAEEEAIKARLQLKAILDCAPSYIFAVDTSGRVQFVNRIASMRLEEYLGKEMFQFMPPGERERVRGIFEQVKARRVGQHYEILVPRPRGESAWYDSYMGPIMQDDEVTGVVVVSQDNTEKRQLEARLVASERMASMGLLAAGVAHEINNPLTAVVANLEMATLELEDHEPRATELLPLLKDTRVAAERVRVIVQDLRLFSRAEEESRTIAIRPILESSLRIAQNELRNRARVVASYEDTPPVEANESRLGQVFLNLLINAAQSIKEGHPEKNELRVRASTTPNGEALLEISDTGAGMSAEVKQRIFEPFFTTKPAGVGTGLGLSICMRIISGFNGRIEVESEEGKGTTFRIYLPAAKRQLVVSSPTPPMPTQRREKILVIDDEVSIGAALRRLLSGEHEVTFLSSAKEALLKTKAGERFALILCDLMMEELNGEDYFHALQQLSPAQARRLIFMTGGAFTPQTRDFLTRSTNPRLEKPFDSRELRGLVNRMLREWSES